MEEPRFDLTVKCDQGVQYALRPSWYRVVNLYVRGEWFTADKEASANRGVLTVMNDAARVV